MSLCGFAVNLQVQNSVNGFVFGYDASKFHSSNLAVFRDAFYPKGIVSISPGLARRAYPGFIRPHRMNHNVVLSCRRRWPGGCRILPRRPRLAQDRTALRFNFPLRHRPRVAVWRRQPLYVSKVLFVLHGPPSNMALGGRRHPSSQECEVRLHNP